MKTLKISKTYKTQDSFFNSAELAEVFSPYAKSELERFKRVSAKSKFEFAVVVDVDPSLNYGRAFKLYKAYSVNASRYFKEVSAISILSNASLNAVVLTEDEISFSDGWVRPEKVGEFFQLNQDEKVRLFK